MIAWRKLTELCLWSLLYHFGARQFGAFPETMNEWVTHAPATGASRAGRTIWRWRYNAPQYNSRRCREKTTTVIISGNIAFISKLCYHWLNGCDITVYLSVFIGYIPRSSHLQHAVFVQPGWHVRLSAVVPAMQKRDVVRSVQIFIQDCSLALSHRYQTFQEINKRGIPIIKVRQPFTTILSLK